MPVHLNPLALISWRKRISWFSSYQIKSKLKFTCRLEVDQLDLCSWRNISSAASNMQRHDKKQLDTQKITERHGTGTQFQLTDKGHVFINCQHGQRIVLKVDKRWHSQGHYHRRHKTSSEPKKWWYSLAPIENISYKRVSFDSAEPSFQGHNSLKSNTRRPSSRSRNVFLNMFSLLILDFEWMKTFVKNRLSSTFKKADIGDDCIHVVCARAVVKAFPSYFWYLCLRKNKRQEDCRLRVG